MGNVLEFPSKAKIEAAIRESGSLEKAASVLGYKPRTLREFCRREGTLEEMKALGRQTRQKQSVVPTDIESVSREEQLEAEVGRLQRQVNQSRKSTVLDSLVLERFDAAFGNAKPRYSPLVIPKSHRKSELHEHVLLWSDAHANEVVSLEETMGINEYDWSIMLKRMGRVQDSVLSFLENRPYPVRKLHVPMLGDNFSGRIHQELLETNEMPHEESVVQFALDTSDWLEGFVPHYGQIDVSGVIGNHPRPTQKPMAKRAFDNSDWTYYRFIESRLRGSSTFNWNFPKAKFADILVAERWRMLLFHGDGVRSTMVDVPWGGIIRYIGKLARQFQQAGKPIDYYGLGHYHQANAIGAGGPGSKTFINASLKGPDEYSIQRFGGGEPPGQLLLTFHPRRGVTDVSYLDCEDPIPAAELLLGAA